MSIHDFVSDYTGAFPDRLKQLLLANTTGTASTWTINDLWMKFLTERGFTSGSLDDRMRQWLLGYTGATTGTNADLWERITEPFSEGGDLLDSYPGALRAYSTGRRLKSDYTGALFRVRRSSDNAEQDIGFVPETGLVNTSALTTFVGAGDGLVTTIYDQSGNITDIGNGTAAGQPAIVLAGVVQTFGSNSIPAPRWDGSNDNLSSGNLAISSESFSVWWACRDLSHAAAGILLNFGTTSVGAGEWAIQSPNGAANNIALRANATTDTTQTTQAAPFSYVGRARSSRNAADPHRNIRHNKAADASATTSTGTYATQNLWVGLRSDATLPYNGMIGEFVLYANQNHIGTDGIDDNMMSFWGIS